MKTSGLEQATLWVSHSGQIVRAQGRSGLLTKLSATRAEKIFRDKRDGPPVHCGYIVRGQWWSAYAPVEVPA